MGFMDKFDELKDKALDTAAEHSDKVEAGVDKAADFIDEKTDGKHSDKIDSAAETIKDKLIPGN